MGEAERHLATELKTFEKHKQDLLGRWEGKYVLITGDNILGAYDSKLDAVAAGHQQIGARPFLVKKVERIEKPVRILARRG